MIALDVLQVALLAVGAAATRCGYTVCFHAYGKGAGEYVAVPWNAEAISAEKLIKAMAEEVGIDQANVFGPVERVFGRVSYCLELGKATHILMHITPRYSVFKIDAPQLSEPGMPT